MHDRVHDQSVPYSSQTAIPLQFVVDQSFRLAEEPRIHIPCMPIANRITNEEKRIIAYLDPSRSE